MDGGGGQLGELPKHSAKLPYILFIVETFLLLKIGCAPDIIFHIPNLLFVVNLSIVIFY